MPGTTRALLAAASVAGLVIAGCGDGGVEGPAELVPADAPAYFEVTVRPEGEARAGAEAAAAKLLDTNDPGAKIISLLEDAAAEQGQPVDYEHDIAPWLGERVGFLVPDLEDESGVALVIETTDPAKALDYIRIAEETAEGRREREFEGTGFQFNDEGDAFGLVGDFLVFGDAKGFKQAVSTEDSGDSLAESGSFQDAVDDLPEDSLATLYADPKTFIEAVPEDEPSDATGKDVVTRALGEAGEQPVLGSAIANATGIEIELSAGGTQLDSEPSKLVEQLPASAWLALGLSDIGGAVEAGLKSLEDAGIPGVSKDAIAAQVKSVTGIDLDRDVIGALGDAALFVSGTSTKDLGGALVIESKDTEATAGLLDKLRRLIKRQGAGSGVRVQPLSGGGAQGFQLTDPSGGLTQPIKVYQRGDQLVAGYGDQATGDLLSGGQTLADDPSYLKAKDQIGSLGIDLFVSIAPILELAESEGAGSDPGYQTAKPYLHGLNFLVLGTGTQEDRSVLTILLGIR